MMASIVSTFISELFRHERSLERVFDRVDVSDLLQVDGVRDELVHLAQTFLKTSLEAGDKLWHGQAHSEKVLRLVEDRRTEHDAAVSSIA